jgi:hypothetical protein
MDPDVVTNCPQSDHRKSKLELRHGIKLVPVFFVTESEFWFSKNICDRCIYHKVPYFLKLKCTVYWYFSPAGTGRANPHAAGGPNGTAPNRASNIRKLLCKFYYYKWLVLHTHIFKFHHVTPIDSEPRLHWCARIVNEPRATQNGVAPSWRQALLKCRMTSGKP